MKILITSNYRPGNETGSARVSEELSFCLSKRYDVTYLCLGNKYRKRRVKKNLHYLQIPSIPIKQGFVPKLTPNVINKIFLSLDRFHPNVIHAQNVVFLTLVCLIWAIKNRVAFIITFHSLPSEGIVYIFPRLSKNRVVDIINLSLTKSYLRNLLERVDLIIALNQYVERSIRDVYKEARIKKINNGIDLKPFLRLNIKKPQQTKNFIFIGSYMPRKNQLYLLMAFRYLPPNFKLTLYGKIETGKTYVEKLRKTMKKYQISNVEIRDFVQREKLLDVLKGSDYFVSASIKEVQSLAIIESLAAGTPVIGLNNETIEELINGKCGKSLPKNISPKKFAEELKRYVYKSESNYYNIAKNCKKSIKGFDIDNVIKEIVKTYRQTVKGKKREKLPESELNKIISKQFLNLFYKILPELKGPTTLKLRFLLILSLLGTISLWPLMTALNAIKAFRGNLTKRLSKEFLKYF